MASHITATERGRKLVITLADDDSPLEIVVPPVNTAVGSELYALWMGVLFAKSDTPIEDAELLAAKALGEENLALINDLRSEEATTVINAAFFWNVQGGGIELTRELLRDGLPKARLTLASNNGSGTELSLLMTLLATAKGAETRVLDATSAISSRRRIGESFRRKLGSQTT